MQTYIPIQFQEKEKNGQMYVRNSAIATENTTLLRQDNRVE
jgi:hypothetical protein